MSDAEPPDDDGDDDQGEPGEESFETYQSWVDLQRNTFRHQLPDFQLELLVRLVNNTDANIGITVWVGGTAASGLLVSPPRWLDIVAAYLGEVAAGNESAEGLADAYRTMSIQMRMEEAVLDEQERHVGPVGLHMVDVDVEWNGEVRTVAAWRGRLIEVDSWILGNFRAHVVPD